MHNKTNSIRGFSLVELAICLLIISVALIPVILAVTGSHKAKSTTSSELLSEERAVASSLLETATVNNPDFLSLLKTNGVFNQRNLSSKIKTDILNYPNSDISYRWIFKNLTYSGINNTQVLPDGNYLIDVALEIYNKESLKVSPKPVITFGTKVLVQKPQQTYQEPHIGIMLVVDLTPSMAMSNYGWAHLPMRVPVLPKTNLKQKAEKGQIPVPIFNETTPPEKVIDYIGRYYTPQLIYSGNFAFPYQNYSNLDDFVFLKRDNDSKTPFNEKYLPPILNKEQAKNNKYAVPYDQDQATNRIQQYYEELHKFKSNSNNYNGPASPNVLLSRAEMMRSSLYLFLSLIEDGKAGPPRYFKIGFVPFSNIVKQQYLLPPVAPNNEGKFIKLQQYIKSINRTGAPLNYIFNLTSRNNKSSDIENALLIAHNTLIKDKSLTDRVIIVITDWNPCIELSKTIDIKDTRDCISTITGKLEAEMFKVREKIMEKSSTNPNYSPSQGDPLVKRYKEIKKTIKIMKTFIPDISSVDGMYQPYHQIYKNSCVLQEVSEPLNTTAKKISNGTINSANNVKTDIYIIGIADAARLPSSTILANLTTESKNGQYYSEIEIDRMDIEFQALVYEMSRLLKIKQMERYKWTQYK